MSLFEDFLQGSIPGYFYVYKDGPRHMEALAWATEYGCEINSHSPLVFFDSILILDETRRVEFKLRFF